MRLWQQHAETRKHYAESIPLPGKSFFYIIESLEELSCLIVELFANPCRLLLDAIFYFCKCILGILATIVLLPVVIIANCCKNKSFNSTFWDCAIGIIASLGMGLLGAISAIAAIVCNPVNLGCRIIGTVCDVVNDFIEPCFR